MKDVIGVEIIALADVNSGNEDQSICYYKREDCLDDTDRSIFDLCMAIKDSGSMGKMVFRPIYN